ncbi:hypothetical protein TraAM80_07963 [Trypanosoma rangeli]|uniref:Uncharacterized protein n=1 Tax=Trypanosoma rangeli TaxID=5698 RepID=A0A422N310_TRYRA|nr:uncharacterized protein TraAM80_07963 [Trypanosoma rangeli]RNE99843.1 hypothetical protein TraAM80_07963 [Trypanosoma rangeli]|eukprot:RNE99843.1 hypothetical protein TraAM80_07963 [Trypanosoma rangeli]
MLQIFYCGCSCGLACIAQVPSRVHAAYVFPGSVGCSASAGWRFFFFEDLQDEEMVLSTSCFLEELQQSLLRSNAPLCVVCGKVHVYESPSTSSRPSQPVLLRSVPRERRGVRKRLQRFHSPLVVNAHV